MTLIQGHISNVKVTVHTYLKSVSGPWLLAAMLDQDNISHNCCPWLKDVPWPWVRVISPWSRSQFTHGTNLFPGHYLSRVAWMGMIHHTIVVHDQGVVVDSPWAEDVHYRFWGQKVMVTVHWLLKIVSGAKLFPPCTPWNFAHRLPMSQGCPLSILGSTLQSGPILLIWPVPDGL